MWKRAHLCGLADTVGTGRAGCGCFTWPDKVWLPRRSWADRQQYVLAMLVTRWSDVLTLSVCPHFAKALHDADMSRIGMCSGESMQYNLMNYAQQALHQIYTMKHSQCGIFVCALTYVLVRLARLACAHSTRSSGERASTTVLGFLVTVDQSRSRYYLSRRGTRQRRH